MWKSNVGLFSFFLFLIFCFSDFQALAQTSTRPPGTVASASGGAGTIVWATPTNAIVVDGVFTTAALGAGTTTQRLLSTNFGFAISPDMMIDGIEVNVNCKYAGGGAAPSAQEVQLYLGGVVGTNQAAATPLSTAQGTLTFGGPTNLWGTTWTPAQINNSTFGATFAVQHNGGAAKTLSVDWVSIKVYFHNPLNITSVNSISFCQGGAYTIPFKMDLAVSAGNVYNLELSTNTGTFPGTNIANIPSTALTGTFTGNFPVVANSNAYRVRITSTNPVINGVDNGSNITIWGTVPTDPVANNIPAGSCKDFTATWSTSTGAAKYFLDVCTDAGYTNYVPGFNNKDMGLATSAAVTNLNSATTYFYRVKAWNGCGYSNYGPATGITGGPGGQIYTVTANTDANAGAGNSGDLRWCVNQSNTNCGHDIIRFSAAYTITLTSPLPLTDDAGVTIDGTTAPGYLPNTVNATSGSPLTSAPKIVILTSGATVTAFNIASNSYFNDIKGLVLQDIGDGTQNLTSAGITINGNYNNVLGCFIGTNAAGTAKGGTKMAVGISVMGSYNQIGDGTPAGVNLIGGTNGGNRSAGIMFTTANSTNNSVRGNFIGLLKDGINFVPAQTQESGVIFYNTSGGNNIVGGSNPGDGNVISGNLYGVDIENQNSSVQYVKGNIIGPQANGTTMVPTNRQQTGVLIMGTGGGGHVIGGTGPYEKNILSANLSEGISMNGSTKGNKVIGNIIGLDISGTTFIAGTTQDYGIHIFPSADGGHQIGGRNPGEGNVISGNYDGATSSAGIWFESPGPLGSTVIGNIIGLQKDGMTYVANNKQQMGVWVYASPNNIIGGNQPGEKNTISGNEYAGVELQQATTTGTIIKGNFIGPNMPGTGIVPNATQDNGVYTATNIGSGNVIGGTSLGDGNVISGNSDGAAFGTGIYFNNTASPVTAQGNIIGLQGDGLTYLNSTNQNYGVYFNSSPNNIFGGVGTARNVVSGNDTVGVFLTGTSSGNVIKGNIIGLDKNGVSYIASSTQDEGVYIGTTASNNNIIGGTNPGEGNVISGNYGGSPTLGAGIYVVNTAGGNSIFGNIIGTQADGSSTILGGNNQAVGVFIQASPNNAVGGNTAGARNTISGNSEYGVYVQGTGTGNTIKGNYIGLNAAGTGIITGGAKQQIGVFIATTASTITIGGTGAGDGNVVSGNDDGTTSGGRGIYLANTAGANSVLGNIIGPQANGTSLPAGHNQGYGIWIQAIANNIIGGNTAAARNTISCNFQNGIYIQGGGATGNVIKGNYIGLNSSGTGIIAGAKQSNGIWITVGANTIGGTGAGDGNVISGNEDNSNTGAGIYLSGATGTTILGNIIGTQANGSSDLTGNNQTTGIWIPGSPNNIIGGNTAAARNIISGNTNKGIYIDGATSTGTSIKGNYIGLNSAGTGLIAGSTQDWGIFINTNAPATTIGGTGAGDGNVISGNDDGTTSGGRGIQFSNTVGGNSVLGNIIGPQANGTTFLTGNNQSAGVYVEGTPNNIIGGSAAGARNIISGNADHGVIIIGTANGTVIKGNYIGYGSSVAPLSGSAQKMGVYMYEGAKNTRIGGNLAGEANVIAGHTVYGVAFWASTPAIASGATGNLISRNLIYNNAGKEINLAYTGANPANTGIPAPVITGATFTTISGTGINGNTIEIYKNTTGNCNDATTFVGTAIVAAGAWSYTGTFVTGEYILATQTDGSSNTSEFSLCVPVGISITTSAIAPTSFCAGSPVSIPFTITGTFTAGNIFTAQLSDASGSFATITPLGSITSTTAGTIVCNMPVMPVGAGYRIRVVSSNPVVIGSNNGTNLSITGPTPLTFTVVNTGDLGAGGGLSGDLRWCISQANLNCGHDIINFNLGPGGPFTINAATPLPSLTDMAGVTINGWDNGANSGTANTIPVFNATTTNVLNPVYKIIITSSVASGLVIPSDSNVVQGLVFKDIGDGSVSPNDIAIDISGKNNKILGCFIGMNELGTIKGGARTAVGIQVTGSNNQIGDGTAGGANLISGLNGSFFWGIRFASSTSTGNKVRGNIIGLQKDGSTVVAGHAQQAGVFFNTDAGANNVIGGSLAGEGNVISGNLSYGIFANSFSAGAIITGNIIGTQADGNSFVASSVQTNGIAVSNSSNFTIGGNTINTRNIISGNDNIGINITGAGSSGNIIKGNYIGINGNGTGIVGNSQDFGIQIIASAGTGNVIGGSSAGEGNLISGNLTGIYLNNALGGTSVLGNIIGPQKDGSTFVSGFNQIIGVNIAASNNNIIGGNTSSARNIISGNDNIGIKISSGTTGTIIKGNYIGINASGTAVITGSNQDYGINIDPSAGSGNIIGGTSAGEGNLISGNFGYGVSLQSTVGGNSVVGNIIGPQADGLTFVTGNQTIGLGIVGSPNNTIGGNTSSARNIISGNPSVGIDIYSAGSNGNTIKGNYIGLNINGTSPLVGGNQNAGIFLESNAGSGNVIGGTSAGDANVISGNVLTGVYLQNTGAGVSVLGNIIGTQSDGLTNVTSNTQNNGIYIEASSNNIIGGNTASARNIISGNNQNGINITGAGSTGNSIKGNYIGAGASASAVGSSSQDYGIYVQAGAANNIIGGAGAGDANTIAFNTVQGVYLTAVATTGNLISRNLIYTNVGKPVNLNYGASQANGGIPAPVISVASITTISGTANAGATIEIFKNSAGNCFDATTYLGTVTAAGGVWSLSGAFTLGDYILVNQTDGSNNTSEFACKQVANTIITGVVSPSTFCAGATVSIPYTAAGTFLAGNIFTAQISDATGSFASPTNIGTLASLTSGTINGTIPALTPGTLYRIRVISSNPVVTGIDNGTNLTMGGPQTYTVTSLADGTTVDGVSLRWAITQANANCGHDVIKFNFGAGGPFTINLTTALPNLTDMSGVTIDGWNNSGNNGTPNTIPVFNATTGTPLNPVYKIIISSSIASGLTLASDSNVVQGLVLQDLGDGTPSNNDIAINITGRNNKILGCFIGLDATGTTKGTLTAIGIQVSGSNNQIGDGTAAGANVISGLNGNQDGIIFTNATSTGNSVRGNIIGLQKDGSTVVAGQTQFTGVFFNSNAGVNNVIGGSLAGEGNVISGNKSNGIDAFNNTSGATILGNIIGPQADGNSYVTGNLQITGISIRGSSSFVIGGNTVNSRNVISANDVNGININNAGSNGNIIKGNYLGINASGNGIITGSNQDYGVFMGPSAGTGNIIGGASAGEGNVISGNSAYGIYLQNASGGSNILGNIIGPQANGSSYVTSSTQTNGVLIFGSPNNIVGGNTSFTRNIISGNSSTGLAIQSAAATGNIVKGNYIGLNVSGTGTITGGSQNTGVSIDVASNTIGGTGAGEANVISGNGSTGVTITSNASGVSILGNIIGPLPDGLTHVASNAQNSGISINSSPNNIIGGNTSSARNIISANELYGINITGAAATGTTIKGNYIGINISGTGFITGSSQDNGINIVSGSGSGHVIGGATAGDGNVISGNSLNGIFLNNSPGATSILGNIIGLQSDGLTYLASNIQSTGITINSSTNNIIGGNNNLTRNIISGNETYGINLVGPSTGNTIKGNYIGIDKTGTLFVAGSTQDNGVYVQSTSASNTIGGSGAGEGNVISGNTISGITLQSTTGGNSILGNIIGLQVDGLTYVTSNTQSKGIFISASPNNIIGGNTASVRNIISGNEQYGIQIIGASTGNSIKGNYIGSGGSMLAVGSASQDYGIFLQTGAANNFIGGNAAGEANTIAFNTIQGIYLIALTTTGNLISQNPIYSNGGKEINLNYGGTQANGGIGFPTITSANPTTVIGTAGANNVVEIFKNTSNNAFDATTYVGTVTADGAGNWTLAATLSGGEYVLATQTNATNNTSEFSALVPVLSVNTITTSAVAAVPYCQGGTINVPFTSSGVFNAGNIYTVQLSNASGSFATPTNLTPTLASTANAGNITVNIPAVVNGSGYRVRVVSSNPATIGTDNGTNILIGAQTYTVNNTGDAGVGAGLNGDLRYCITQANATCGHDIINFNLGAGGPFTINLTSALPNLTDNAGVTIDGWNNSGNNGTPNSVPVFNTKVVNPLNPVYKIIISSTVSSGFVLASDSNIVQGLVMLNIGDGNDVAINITGSNNKILGCYIGMDATGTTKGTQTVTGVLVSGAKNKIGDGTAAGANLISGMKSHGIYFTGATATNNLVTGNIIGLQKDGSTVVAGNTQYVGVFLFTDVGVNNIIGGSLAGEGNVISGNNAGGGYGISINNSGGGTSVLGNIIGPQADGLSNVTASQLTGIYLNNSPNNIIGGNTSTTRNIISDNDGEGVYLDGAGSTGNIIKGNYIGLNKSGTGVITGSRQSYGISIMSNAATNTIGGTGAGEGNVISGNDDNTSNGGYGIYINSAAGGTSVLGNIIGPRADGLTYLTNNKQTTGIFIVGSPNNIIGGNSSSARNIISGNESKGIIIGIPGATGNIVKGNYIGLDASGSATITGSTQDYGIFLNGCDAGNIIGGTGAGEGNVISGNDDGAGFGKGIYLNSVAGGTSVLGNIIGPQADGITRVPSNLQASGIYIDGSPNNIIGGNTSSARNIISVNEQQGIYIMGAASTGNTIKGNYIGINVSGTGTIPGNNQFYGIYLHPSTGTGTVIGGSSAGEGNLVSGNLSSGISINNSAGGNSILGNIIGPQSNGSSYVAGNFQGTGVTINSSPNNIVGGNTSSARNIISANENIGVYVAGAASTTNSIKGNYIGLNASGTGIIAGATQDFGIYIYSDAGAGLGIGGSTAGDGNVISGNTMGGIYLSNAVGGTSILGNIIGPQSDGLSYVAGNNQSTGVFIRSSNNVIGGNTAVVRNIISGNEDYGILLDGSGSTGNSIKGNYIGAGASASAIGSSSQDYGIYLQNGAANNSIGGAAAGEANLIAFNTVEGIYLSDPTTTGNLISRNPIYSNTGKQINLNYGAAQGNNGIAIPAITTAVPGTVSGTANANSVVELFKNTTGNAIDATTYVGTVTADAAGNWTLAAAVVNGDYVLATQTDASNNTSEFSAMVLVANSITTSPIAAGPYCAGSTINVPFTSTGTFNAGNIYSVELSDPSGSFASPTSLTPTLASTANSGIITVSLPITSGTNFRVRVVSTNPALIGTDNGTDFVINPKPSVVTVPPAAVCSPATVDLTAAAVTSGSTAGLTFTYFTDPSALTVLGSPATVSSTGTYFIVGTTIAGCTDTNSVVATINPKPNVLITDPAAVCSPLTVDLTAPAVTSGSTGVTTWGYFSDFPCTSPLATPNSIGFSGTFFIKGMDAAGCFDVQPVTVTVNTTPSVNIINPAPVCTPSTVDLTSPLVVTGSVGVNTWGFFSNAPATIALPSPNAVAASGTYYIKGTSAAGCFDIQPVNVIVRTTPSASISGSTSICSGGTATLTVNFTGTGPWDFVLNDGSTTTPYLGVAANPFTFSVNPVANTNYTLDIVGANGCNGPTSGNALVTINPTPTATITGGTTICSGGTDNLTVTFTGGAGPWTFDYFDGTTTTNVAGVTSPYTLNVSPTSTTTYTITSVTEGSCPGTFSGSATTIVNPIPTATISGGTSICSGGTDNLTVTFTGGAGPWTFDYYDGTTTTNVAGVTSPYTLSVNPTSTTTYTITSVIEGSCPGTFSGSATTTVNPAPTATITGGTSICSGGTDNLTVTFTGGAGPWTFDYYDGTTTTNVVGVTSPYTLSVNPTSTTIYTITSVTEGSCPGTFSGSATTTVNPTPTATISGGTSICSGGTDNLTVTFTGGAGPWTFDYFDGITTTNVAGVTSPYTLSVSPTSTTTYTITSVTEGSCPGTFSGSATTTVNPTPTATISGGTSICSGGTDNLTVTFTGGAGPWTFDYFDGITTTNVAGVTSPYTLSVSPTSTTTYTITSVTEGSCPGTFSGSATTSVIPAPTATITGGTTICSGGTDNLTVTFTGGAGPWTFDYYDGTTTTNVAGVTSPYTLAVSPTSTTTYTITSVTEGTCPGTFSGSATTTVNPPLSSSLASTANVSCFGSNDGGINFVPASGGSGFYEYSVDNGSSWQTSFNFGGLIAGTYQLVLRDQLNISCFISIGSVTITEPAALSSGISSTTNVTCYGANDGTINFNPATGGSGLYEYSIDNGSSWQASPNFAGLIPVTYQLVIRDQLSPSCVVSIGSVMISDGAVISAVITGGTSICSGGTDNLLVTFTGSGGPWTFDYFDGTTTTNVAGVSSPYTLSVSPTSTTTYTITSVTEGACPGTFGGSATTTVNPAPTATITGGTTICSGGTDNLTVTFTGGVGPWTFDYFDGTTTTNIAGVSSPYTLAVSPTSTTTYTITSVTEGSCPGTFGGSATTTVNPTPTATITGGISICSGGTDNLTVTFTGGAGPWTFDYFDGITTTNVAGVTSPYTLSVNPTSTTTYTITSVTEGSCPGTFSGSATTTVNPAPTATITGGTTICSGGTDNLTVTFTGGAGPWTFDYFDGTTTTNIAGVSSPYTLAVSPTSTTTYTITSVTEGSCPGTFSGSATTTVNPTPTATITGGTSICSGGTDNLTVTFTGGAGPWTFDYFDGITTTNVAGVTSPYTLVVNPTSTTTYTITSVTEGSCPGTTSGSATTTVNPVPTATISGGTTICPSTSDNLTVTFTGGSGPWDFDYFDGVSTISVTGVTSPYTLTVSPASTTTYTITSVTEGTCPGTFSGSATTTINPLPTAVFSGDQTICSGNSANFTVTFTGSGPWDFDWTDGITIFQVTGNGANPYNFAWPSPTTTNFSIVNVKENGCMGTASGTALVTVNPGPTATLSGSTSICSGGTSNITVTLTGTGPWDFDLFDGSTTTSYTSIPTSPYVIPVSPASTTNYTITSVTNSSCTGTTSGNALVTVNPTPTATITGGTSICSGGTDNLTVTFTGGAGPWTFDYFDGVTTTNIAGVTSPYTLSVNPTSTTTYTITSVTEGTCPGTFSGSATTIVNPIPTATISGGTSICSGGTDNLTVTFTGGAGPWTFDYFDGTTITNVAGVTSPYTLSVNPTSTTTYTITSVTEGSCPGTFSGSATTTVNPTPTATITGGTSICSGGTDNLTVTFTGGAGPWTFDYFDGTTTTNIAGVSSPYTLAVSLTSTTTYTITSVTEGSCPGTFSGSATTTVNPTPTATISGGTSICSGGTDNLTVTFTGGAGPWTFDYFDGVTTTNIAGVTSPYTLSVNPTVTTTYTITSVTEGACPGTFGGSATTTVNPTPTATITGGTSICSGGTDNLTVTFTGGAGPWTFDYFDGTATTNVAGVTSPYTLPVSPTSTTTYTITSVTEGSCPGTFSGSVTTSVIPAPTATITGGTTICSGGTDNLTVTFTGGAGPWTFDYYDGTTTTNVAGVSSPYTLTVNPTSTTTYTITSVTEGSCPGTFSGSATTTVNSAPTATITGGTTICSGGTDNLTVTFTGGAGPWTFDYYDGTTTTNVAGVTSPYTLSVSPTSTTTYTITSVTEGSCPGTFSGSATTTVNPTPTATITGGTSICSGATDNLIVTFTGGAGPWTFDYFDGITTTNVAGVTSPYTLSVNPTSTTTYTITSVTEGSCPGTFSGSATTTVNLSANQLIAVSAGDTLCLGSSSTIVILASEIGVDYQADFGGSPIGSINTGNGGNINLTIPYGSVPFGRNIVQIRATKPGCPYIYMNNKSTVDMSSLTMQSVSPGSAILCAGTTVNLSVPNNAYHTYQWYMNDTTYVVGANTNNYDVVTAGRYAIQITDTLFCTLRTAKVKVDPPLVAPTVTVSGTQLSTGVTSAYYQWYVITPSGNRAIYGANSRIYQTYYNADYFVALNYNNCREVSTPVTLNNGAFTALARKNFIMNDSIIFIVPPTFEEGELVIFPNPSDGAFTIDYKPSGSDPVVIELYDSHGVKILSRTYPSNSGIVADIFSDLGLRAGMYHLSVIEGSRRITKNVQIN